MLPQSLSAVCSVANTRRAIHRASRLKGNRRGLPDPAEIRIVAPNSPGSGYLAALRMRRAITMRCTSDGPSKMRITRTRCAICCNGISLVMPMAPKACMA